MSSSPEFVGGSSSEGPSSGVLRVPPPSALAATSPRGRGEDLFPSAPASRILPRVAGEARFAAASDLVAPGLAPSSEAGDVRVASGDGGERPASAFVAEGRGNALPRTVAPAGGDTMEVDTMGVDTVGGVNVERGKASSRDGGRPDPGSAVDLEPYRPRLQRFAVATFRVSREDAEDAAQETLIRARNVQFDGRDPFNFLARVLANVVITHRRRRRVPTISLDAPMESGLGTYLDGLAGDDRDVRAAEARVLLDGLVLTLTASQQRALALWEETPNAASVGRALGVSRQRAHRLLAEARAALRARLRGVASGDR